MKEQRTVSQLASEYNLHPNQISTWKKQLLSTGGGLFSQPNRGNEAAQAAQEAELYEQIGRLKMALEWLKKKLPYSTDHQRELIEPGHRLLSLRRQGELIGLNRASYYDQPTPESALNLALMRLIDEPYLQTPFYGYPQMTVHLRRAGYQVNPKRIYRLMRLMGLQAVGPKPNTSQPRKGHQIYPYLLSLNFAL